MAEDFRSQRARETHTKRTLPTLDDPTVYDCLANHPYAQKVRDVMRWEKRISKQCGSAPLIDKDWWRPEWDNDVLLRVDGEFRMTWWVGECLPPMIRLTDAEYEEALRLKPSLRRLRKEKRTPLLRPIDLKIGIRRFNLGWQWDERIAPLIVQLREPCLCMASSFWLDCWCGYARRARFGEGYV